MATSDSAQGSSWQQGLGGSRWRDAKSLLGVAQPLHLELPLTPEPVPGLIRREQRMQRLLQAPE